VAFRYCLFSFSMKLLKSIQVGSCTSRFFFSTLTNLMDDKFLSLYLTREQQMDISYHSGHGLSVVIPGTLWGGNFVNVTFTHFLMYLYKVTETTQVRTIGGACLILPILTLPMTLCRFSVADGFVGGSYERQNRTEAIQSETRLSPWLCFMWMLKLHPFLSHNLDLHTILSHPFSTMV
jgi:hypothetical protein